jgi:hypothetical protein
MLYELIVISHPYSHQPPAAMRQTDSQRVSLYLKGAGRTFEGELSVNRSLQTSGYIGHPAETGAQLEMRALHLV